MLNGGWRYPDFQMLWGILDTMGLRLVDGDQYEKWLSVMTVRFYGYGYTWKPRP